MIRMFTPAVAVWAITLRAGLPLSVVIANVVRAIAALSGPIAVRMRASAGPRRPALAMRVRMGSGAWGASRRNSSTVGAGTLEGIGDRSSRVIARASRAVGPIRAGVEAWPPRPSTRSSIDMMPFSVTPTTPTGLPMPAKASWAIAPPSSTTNQGRTSRRSSSATASSAAVPNTSSSQPKESHTSCAGVKSASSRVSTASQIPTRQPLSSRVPRPQIWPSTTAPLNASCCQVPPTGTTSLWAISTIGRAALEPGQWKSSPWVCTLVSSSRSCSSGNWRASSSTNVSNAAVSTRSGSR